MVDLGENIKALRLGRLDFGELPTEVLYKDIVKFSFRFHRLCANEPEALVKALVPFQCRAEPDDLFPPATNPNEPPGKTRVSEGRIRLDTATFRIFPGLGAN